MEDLPSNQKEMNLSQVNENQSEISKEWNLFWKFFRSTELPDIEEDEVAPLSLEQISELSKSLSNERKELNRRLEVLNKEIDLNSSKLETVRLVGSDDQEILERLGELNDQGIQISTRLHQIDQKIKDLRTFEEKLLQQDY